MCCYMLLATERIQRIIEQESKYYLYTPKTIIERITHYECPFEYHTNSKMICNGFFAKTTNSFKGTHIFHSKNY